MQKPVDNFPVLPRPGKSVQGSAVTTAADPIPLPLTFESGVGSVDAEDSTSLSFYTNGVKRARVTPNGLEIVPSGTEALPSLTLGSTVGLYSAAGEVSVSANETRGAYVDSQAFHTPRLIAPYSTTQPQYAFTEEPTTGLSCTDAATINIQVQGNAIVSVSDTAVQCHQPLTMKDGTQVVPSISHEDQPFNGLFYEASDTMGISIDEESCLKVSPTTTTFGKRLILPAGTAASPALRCTSDSNSGFYRSSTGVTSVSSAGAEVARFEPTKAHFPQGIALGPVGTDILSIYQVGTSTFTMTATNFTFTSGSGAIRWLRIGPAVFMHGTYSWTGIGGAGTASIVNVQTFLPFLTNTVVHTRYIKNVNSADTTLDGNCVIVVQANSTSGQFAAFTTAGAWSPGFTGSQFDATGGSIRFTCSYNVT